MTAGEAAQPFGNSLGLYLTPPSAHLPSRLTQRGASREAEQICIFLRGRSQPAAARCNGTPVKPSPIAAPADTGPLHAAHNHTHTHTQACSPPLNTPCNQEQRFQAAQSHAGKLNQFSLLLCQEMNQLPTDCDKLETKLNLPHFNLMILR